jgi:hypothetical protein
MSVCPAVSVAACQSATALSGTTTAATAYAPANTAATPAA